MARFKEPTPEQESGWNEWVAGRPDNVRVVAERFDPWSLYRMKTTGHRVTVASFAGGQDGNVTLTVVVTGEFNAVAFDRSVFGVDPHDLEPCDLPSDAEPVGTLMTEEEVRENLDVLRVTTRPDLFELGPDGKARRKDN